MARDPQSKPGHDLNASMGRSPSGQGASTKLPLHLIALDAIGTIFIAAGILSFTGTDLPLVRLIEPNPVGIICIAIGLGLMLPLVRWIIQRARASSS